MAIFPLSSSSEVVGRYSHPEEICAYRALMTAIGSGRLETVDKVLEQYPDFDVAQEKRALTPLTLAAASGQMDILLSLLERGARVDQAAPNDSLVSTKDLIDNTQYRVTRKLPKGATALYAASASGHVDIICCLLERRSDVNHTTSVPEAIELRDDWLRGASALYIAAYNGHAAAVRCLLQARADVNLSTKKNILKRDGSCVLVDQETPLIAALQCELYRKEMPRMVRDLLCAGARFSNCIMRFDATWRNTDKVTNVALEVKALMLAAWYEPEFGAFACAAPLWRSYYCIEPAEKIQWKFLRDALSRSVRGVHAEVYASFICMQPSGVDGGDVALALSCSEEQVIKLATIQLSPEILFHLSGFIARKLVYNAASSSDKAKSKKFTGWWVAAAHGREVLQHIGRFSKKVQQRALWHIANGSHPLPTHRMSERYITLYTENDSRIGPRPRESSRGLAPLVGSILGT